MTLLGLPFLFTDGHAMDALSRFYDLSRVKDIPHLLDFTAIRAAYWNDEQDLDLKRRKEAELLVEKDVPLEAILGYVVYNDAAKTKLEYMGISPDKIVVKPTYYFKL